MDDEVISISSSKDASPAKGGYPGPPSSAASMSPDFACSQVKAKSYFSPNAPRYTRTPNKDDDHPPRNLDRELASARAMAKGGFPKFDLSDSSDVDVVVDEDGMEEKYEVPEPLSDARPEGSLILGNLSDGSRATILTPVASMIQIMPDGKRIAVGLKCIFFLISTPRLRNAVSIRDQ